jgi:hypothetical protein
MDLAGANGEVDPLEDGLVIYTGLKITDLEQYGGVRADHRVSGEEDGQG